MSSNMHPIDQFILPEMKISSINIRSNNYKTETRNLIQRQRIIKSFLYRSDDNEPSIRKPSKLSNNPKELSITSMSSSQILLTELNEQHNRQKKDIDRQPPILIRRQRPTIENLSPIQQVSDITNLLPSHFTFRNVNGSRNNLSDRSSPRLKPLNVSKSLAEPTLKSNSSHSKTLQPVNNQTWTPKLFEPNSTSSRTLTGSLRAKSQLSKYAHQRSPNNSKTTFVQDLYISPRILNTPSNDNELNKKIPNTKFVIEDWNDRKIVEEDESISTDGNSSTSTCNSQYSVHSSDYSTFDSSKLQIPRLSNKRTLAKRRPYNLVLAPVAEHHDDDEQTDTNEENSLTFEILNQQETIFEKQLRDL